MSDLRPRTSTRNLEALGKVLAPWLREKLRADRLPTVAVTGGPTGAGFSSETVLFDAQWHRAGEAHSGTYVLRLPPPADAFPLFPRYDLARQVAAMRLVGQRTRVPVPDVPWFEADSSLLGSPFFVMDRIDGVAAADMPPYVLGGWLASATPAQQATAEAGVIRALEGIHGMELIDRAAAFGFLEFDAPGDTPLRRHVANQRSYYDWIREGRKFPLIEDMFDFLADTWPEVEGPAVVSWGDSRVANVLFRGFDPVAVLDWEAVALGPRELDLGWLVFFHEYFQRIARRLGKTGMPEFLAADRVIAAYTAATGYQPQRFDWYLAYAALRQALTSIRVSCRAVHFNEREMPADPQDLIIVRSELEDILAGRFLPNWQLPQANQGDQP
ncbi:phosphotransferase family protein [Yinghuangia aomiensis]|uniref:Phosphotransferase family protein n=1 Tax=Yinghuangia aomiensis TaxID=676205 RepID=A0ABP9IIS1_9ACTN